jgi:hypothetical protein
MNVLSPTQNLVLSLLLAFSIGAHAAPDATAPIGGGRSFDDGEVGAYVFRFYPNGGGYLVLQKAPKSVHLPYTISSDGELTYDDQRIGVFKPRTEFFVVIEKTEDGFNVAEIKVDRKQLATYLDSAGKKYTIAELREFLRTGSK